MRYFKTDILIFLRLIKNLNILRSYNLFQLYISYIISRIRKKPYLVGMPWSISIEPTNSCNLSCPECPTGARELSRPTGIIDQNLFENIIEEAGRKGFFLNLYFQGEPFLNRNLINLIKIANKKRMFISCATNAHYIDNEIAKGVISSGLDHLVISFDGTTSESYKKYRIGGDFELVKNAIKILVEEKTKQNKKYPIIVLQFLILKHNEHQIDEAKEMAKSMGVDKLVFKTAQLYNLTDRNQYLPDNPLHSRYNKLQNGTLVLNHTTKNKCWKSWSSCVITWDGRVAPCCYDKDAAFCYGILGNNNLKEILSGDKSKEYRKIILTNKDGINICTNCPEA
jgi:MoaA/NifB/PqqE/SkfB family radical SAM enzyme